MVTTLQQTCNKLRLFTIYPNWFIQECEFVLQMSKVIVNSQSWRDYSYAVVGSNHSHRNTLIIHLSNNLMSNLVKLQ